MQRPPTLKNSYHIIPYFIYLSLGIEQFALMSKQADIESLKRVSDRLSSTKIEDVCSVLSLLIPKLLPMACDSEYHSLIDSMLADTIIPKLNLLTKSTVRLHGVFEVFNASDSLEVYDLLVKFIDPIIDKQESSAEDEACAVQLLKALSKVELFTPVGNAICYYLLHFLKVVPSAALALKSDAAFSTNTFNTVQNILGDYLLDLMLLYKPISWTVNDSNPASSIQFGLSSQRVARICAKRASFTSADLKTIKLFIIDSLPSNFLSAAHSIAIAVTASCDSGDTEVVMNAMYKVNGAMNLFKINSQEIAVQALELLLTWCSGSNIAPTISNSRELVTKTMSIYRAKLKNDVLVATLRLVVKEFVSYLSFTAKSVLSLVYKNVITANASGTEGNILISNTALPLVAVSMKLYEELSSRMDDATLKASTVVFVQCVKKVLATYTFNLETTEAGGSIAATSQKSSEVNNKEHHLAIRSSCYVIISQLAKKNSALMVLDINLLILIFQLLKNEDERILSSLYGALEALRVAFKGKF